VLDESLELGVLDELLELDGDELYGDVDELDEELEGDCAGCVAIHDEYSVSLM
jgi:hypothetical protein